MKRTVSSQMTDAERRQRLIKGLEATGAEEVCINFSHLAQAVGMTKAESLVGNLVQTNELVKSPMSSKVTMKRAGMCTVDRVAVLEACNKADIDSVTKVPSPPKK